MTTSADTAWQRCTEPPALEDGVVHVWRVDLVAAVRHYEAARQLLAADELVKADCYTFEAPRRTYVAGRAALRRLLGRYLELEPAALRFVYGDQGKPALDGPATLSFNLSHSDAVALIAVTKASRVGVDVEHVHPLRDLDAVAAVCFSPRELAAFAAMPPGARLSAFYNCWTRKEALLKALGGGLALPLKSFSVSLDARAPLIEDGGGRLRPEAWSLLSLQPGAGYVGATVLERPGARVVTLSLDQEDVRERNSGAPS